MAGIILSADIGSSSLKTALISERGELLAGHREPFDNIPAGTDDWESALLRALQGLALKTQELNLKIEAICFSGNGPTIVPVRAGGETLSPIYWNRAKSEKAPGASLFLPLLKSFKNSAPGDYNRTAFFISSHEWLAHRLGASALIVLPRPAYSIYYWDDEQIEIFGLDKSKFLPFIRSGEVMGRVSQESAQFFGKFIDLKSGTPIIAGAPDFISALIGTDTTRPGDICDRAGSSEGINLCLPSPIEVKGLRLLPHFKEELWNLSYIIPNSGALFEQYRVDAGLLDRSYDELLSELIPSDFRYTGEKIPNPSLPGNYIERGRAILYNMAFSVRRALELLMTTGITPEKMRVSGGQGINSSWNQLKADITGIPLMIPEISDAELMGNAILALGALGIPCDNIIRFREEIIPNIESKSFWDDAYKIGS
ncbi:MAG: FGGY-family carbohydrate kinase [Treponema sp.]|nr:FGGY-family carbohydrate kinase [Treponema sp.]